MSHWLVAFTTRFYRSVHKWHGLEEDPMKGHLRARASEGEEVGVIGVVGYYGTSVW